MKRLTIALALMIALTGTAFAEIENPASPYNRETGMHGPASDYSTLELYPAAPVAEREIDSKLPTISSAFFAKAWMLVW